MVILKYILTAVCAYFFGSVSVSILLSRSVMNADVRAHGSGNAGATNMARVFGLRMGVATLAGDMLKAALAMLLGFALLGEKGMCLAGALCLVGHCYPALHEFRGGKGVSVGVAVFLAADWRVLAVAVVFFAAAALLSRKVSLGSLAAYFALPLPRLLLVAFTMLLVVLRHRENIIRLLRGTEPDFSFGSAKRGQSDKNRG